MAIEIVQKPKTETPVWVVVLMVVNLSLLTVLALSYFYFINQASAIESKITDTDNNIKLSPYEELLKKEMTTMQAKINGFEKLLSGHKQTKALFDVLDNSIHPDVWFSDFKFEYPKNQVTVNGQAKSFNALGQQVIIFKNDPSFQSVNLSVVSLEDTGEITFSFILIYQPNVLK